MKKFRSLKHIKLVYNCETLIGDYLRNFSSLASIRAENTKVSFRIKYLLPGLTNTVVKTVEKFRVHTYIVCGHGKLSFPELHKK